MSYKPQFKSLMEGFVECVSKSGRYYINFGTLRNDDEYSVTVFDTANKLALQDKTIALHRLSYADAAEAAEKLAVEN